MTDTADAAPAFPLLDDTEARILGALVEKEATTPEAYPLTANAVQLACNQKTAPASRSSTGSPRRIR